MPFLILSVLIQAAFVIHVLKTGRNTTWIWVIVMLPMAGAIAYLVLEILPDFSQSRAGQNASEKVQSVINPNKEINAAARDYSVSDTVENSLRLADECLDKNMYQEAKELYEKSLTGLFSDDPNIMYGLARAEFGLANYNATKEILDRLIKENPDYQNPNAHLLYARTLDSLDDIQAALHEYETLHGYFSGPEAAFHFGVFLKNRGEIEKANTLFKEIIDKSDLSGKHYKSIHKDWIRKAKLEIVS